MLEGESPQPVLKVNAAMLHLLNGDFYMSVARLHLEFWLSQFQTDSTEVKNV